MENKKTSETLEEGFVESKLSKTENPSDEIVEKADSVFLCNLSEKWTADVYSGHSEMSHVELARTLGNGSVEESVVCDGVAGHNQINKGTLNSYSDDKLLVLTNSNRINNDGMPVFERGLKFCGNDGIQIRKDEERVEKRDAELRSHELVQVEKVEEPMEKGDHVLHGNDSGSPTKIDVSGNGINLFVEVFGPLDGISESSNNVNDIGEHMLRESGSDQKYAQEENGAPSPGVKSASTKNEMGDTVGEHECTFDVGDLVWVKTQTPLWWPGMISDPSNAPNDATKSEKRGSFLVKYFGNANFVWCANSDLKPFLEYFEQMSGQNNSRSFFGAVEKALCVIGRRVKSKMTCPCFSKESQALAAHWSTENKEEHLMSVDKISKLDVLSLSQFEPGSFFACIRHLARSVSVPGKIELTVMKNRLSAFYCSTGHRELPLQLLRSSSDAAQNAQDGLTSEVIDEGHNNIAGGGRNSVKGRDDNLTVSRRKKRNHSDNAGRDLDDKIAASGKGSESRERKKSKYLSYPYVDVNKGLQVASTLGQELEDLKHHSGLSTKSTPPGNHAGSSSRKRGSRKPLKGHHMISKADNIDACSAELLTELCSTARDCFYLSRSKYCDFLKRFYSSFRKFSFLDAAIACKDAGDRELPSCEKFLLQNSTEAEVHMEGSGVAKESENQRVNFASVKESVNNTASNKFQKMENLQAKENAVRRRAKKKKEQVISADLESMNNSFGMGTNTTANNSWVINFQQTCSDVPKSRTTPEKRMEGTNPGLPQIDMIARLPDLNGNQPSFSVEHTPDGGPSTNQDKPMPEKKEGLFSPNINGVDQIVFASVPSLKDVQVTLQDIPELSNGYGVNGTNQFWNAEFTTGELESNVSNTGLGSFVQNSLQSGLLPCAGKPERRKRKRKEKTCQVTSVIPDLNGNVLDTSSSGKTLPEENYISPTLAEGNHISLEGKPQQKRKRNKSASTESGSNVKTNRVLNNGEDLGGSLLLIFAPGITLPSKETLVATFCKFGLLKESEIQFLNESSAQIAYERSSDARFAFRSLEKSNPFGASLASFKLHCMPAALRTKEKKNNLQKQQPFVPVDAFKNPARPGETADIAFIRQNVEMMKSNLEKAGDKLSPEMRAKLENEIQGLLNKICSMAGSGSSPS